MGNLKRISPERLKAANLTLLLCLVAWQGNVAINGDKLDRYYNWGNSSLKWFVVTFAEPFVTMIVPPLVIVSIVSWLASGRNSYLRAYNHGLIVAAGWTAFMLYGAWYGVSSNSPGL